MGASAYWENRRMQTLFRGAIADAHKLQLYLLKRQNYRCAITGMPPEDTSESRNIDCAIRHVE